MARICEAINTHFHKNDGTGELANGYRLYAYEAYTETLIDTFLDANESGVHTNPMIIQPDGKTLGQGIFLSEGVKYTFVLKDELDAIVDHWDNIGYASTATVDDLVVFNTVEESLCTLTTETPFTTNIEMVEDKLYQLVLEDTETYSGFTTNSFTIDTIDTISDRTTWGTALGVTIGASSNFIKLTNTTEATLNIDYRIVEADSTVFDAIVGTDGKDGVDGADGVDGTDGLNGLDGVNGIAGKVHSIVAGTGIVVDSSNEAKPIVSIDPEIITQISDNIDTIETNADSIAVIEADFEAHIDDVSDGAHSEKNFTQELYDKLLAVESSKFKGQYDLEADLLLAYPTAEAGSYAFVENLLDPTAVDLYLFNIDDGMWENKGITSSSETAESIKLKYESNADTNGLTDANVAKLDNLPTDTNAELAEIVDDVEDTRSEFNLLKGRVLTDNTDHTYGYLGDKLVAGTNVTIEEFDYDSTDRRIRISATGDSEASGLTVRTKGWIDIDKTFDTGTQVLDVGTDNNFPINVGDYTDNFGTYDPVDGTFQVIKDGKYEISLSVGANRTTHATTDNFCGLYVSGADVYAPRVNLNKGVVEDINDHKVYPIMTADKTQIVDLVAGVTYTMRIDTGGWNSWYSATDDNSFAIRWLEMQVMEYNLTEGTGGTVDSIVAGTNVTVDNSDPKNPIVNAIGCQGTTVFIGNTYTIPDGTTTDTVFDFNGESSSTFTLPMYQTVDDDWTTTIVNHSPNAVRLTIQQNPVDYSLIAFETFYIIQNETIKIRRNGSNEYIVLHSHQTSTVNGVSISDDGNWDVDTLSATDRIKLDALDTGVNALLYTTATATTDITTSSNTLKAEFYRDGVVKFKGLFGAITATSANYLEFTVPANFIIDSSNVYPTQVMCSADITAGEYGISYWLLSSPTSTTLRFTPIENIGGFTLASYYAFGNIFINYGNGGFNEAVL